MLGVSITMIVVLWQNVPVAVGSAIIANIFILITVFFMGLIAEGIIVSLFALVLIAGGLWASSKFSSISSGSGG
jgi:hypothetical protein